MEIFSNERKRGKKQETEDGNDAEKPGGKNLPALGVPLPETRFALFSLWVMRGLTLLIGGTGIALGGYGLLATPLAIVLVLVGLFLLRLFVRIVRPITYGKRELEYSSVFGSGSIRFNEIRYARVWQASYTNMTAKNVVIVLPGFLNIYYFLSTKENGLVKMINKHSVEKRSWMFASEVHKE